jgi:tRNA-2-methylthio-N6-dimethylallyladenosine synthase
MKFFIETYGCQMNVADSELVTSILIEAGNTAVANIDEAEVLLFNTCSVRQHAEDRVLGRISNELKRKKSNPAFKIGVIGCMAQRIGDELVKQNLGIDFVVGVDQYDNLPELFESSATNQFLYMDNLQIYNHIQPVHADSFCGFVTIMRGCNNFCSYCIVPYVRGRERSRPLEDIITDVKNAAAKGIIDITLLGQNVNSYQSDNTSYPMLLKQLNDIDEVGRLRFVTSHPKDLSDELIWVMSTSDKVCEHIHLPMQCGDNEILARMNRKYTIEHYLGLVDKLRRAMPNIAITTDLIAGFPGETEAQFENTIQAMKTVGFDYAFCFKYSNRTGTEASEYLDQVDEELRLLRLQKMIGIQRHQTLLKFKAQVGKTVEVLVEGKSKLGGNQLSGKTRDFKICVFDGTENQTGSIVNVLVTEATAGTLIGKQI